MKIVINASSCRGSGSWYVAKNIVSHILLKDKSNDYFIFLPSEKNIGCGGTIYNVKNGIFNKLLFENLALRRFLIENNIDLLFSLTDTSIIKSPVPQLLLVQQAVICYPVSKIKSFTPLRRLIKILLMRFYFSLNVHDVFFTVQTNSMKENLLESYCASVEKVFVVPSAVERNGKHDRASVQMNILCITSTAWYKNIMFLPGLIKKIKDENIYYKFMITLEIGDVIEFDQLISLYDVHDSIEYLGNVDNSVIHSIINESKFLIMPSFIESFGLPIYEAASCGTPVLCLDEPFNRDGLHNFGVYCENTVDSFFENIMMFTSDSDKYNRLSRDLAKHSLGFKTWSEIADIYIRLFNRIL